jgi:hypothetical protein
MSWFFRIEPMGRPSMFRPDSTELSALAARAFDPQTPPAERDQLIRELSRPLANHSRGVSVPA